LRKLVWVVLITIIFVAVEVFGGLMAHSIAIMSDAAHLTSDALGIGISIVALKISENNANDIHSYGYHRAEVIGAIVSILFIWLVTVWLMVEATFRILYPQTIDGYVMLVVSGICLVFNLIQMSLLHSKDLHDHAHLPGQSCNHDHGEESHHHAHEGCSHNHDEHNHEQKRSDDCHHKKDFCDHESTPKKEKDFEH
jgi:zinc transporter 2